MSDVCVEHCVIEQDCSYFKPKAAIRLRDMPRFPLKETKEMTKEEQFTAVIYYLAKVVDKRSTG
jgi:hypothetical protein